MEEEKIRCVSKLSLHYETKVPLTDMPRVTTSEQAYTLFTNHWSSKINLLEEVYIILINQNSRVLGISHLAMGGFTLAPIDLRHLFSIILLARATGFFIAHNHPSGGITPSLSDINITLKLYEAAKIMDIDFVDHLIVSPFNEYYSFADEGTLKKDSHC